MEPLLAAVMEGEHAPLTQPPTPTPTASTGQGDASFEGEEAGRVGRLLAGNNVLSEKKQMKKTTRRNSREDSAYLPSPKLSSARRSVGCPICFEPIRDPRLLRVCGHTFCYDCLRRAHFRDKPDGWTEALAIPCPMCRTVTHVSSTADLPRNWSLIYDSSDDEEDDFVVVESSSSSSMSTSTSTTSTSSTLTDQEDLHRLPPEEAASFCEWVDHTQADDLPERLLREYEKRRPAASPTTTAPTTSTSTAADNVNVNNNNNANDKVTFLLLGLTGHGKSSLINLLFGRLVAAPGQDQQSTTREVALYEHPLVDGLRFIDTPGFFDSRDELGGGGASGSGNGESGPDNKDEAEARISRFLEAEAQHAQAVDCIVLVCKFSDTQSGAMQRGIRFARQVRDAQARKDDPEAGGGGGDQRCQIVVVLTYSNTKSLGHLASCETDFQRLRAARRKREAVLCRWTAWREAKERHLRAELGEDIRVCAIDNDELAKTNAQGQRVLLNGEPWVPPLVDAILEAKDRAASRIARGLARGTADAEVQSATQRRLRDRMRHLLTVASVSGATGGALVICEATAMVAAEGGRLSVGAMLGAGAAGAALTAVPVLVVGGLGVLLSTAVWNVWTQWKRAPAPNPL